MQVTKRQFISGSIWKIGERLSARGVSLVVSVVLARLLMPEDYGLVSLTVVFTNFSEILIDGGFSTALIRKKDIDEYDYGCVFAVSSIVATCLYLILFFFAPAVARYYNEPKLVSLLRVMGLVLFIQAFSVIRNAVVNRTMRFRLLMKCSIVSAVVSGGAGICAAFYGMGVWALVIQRLAQQFLLTVFLIIGVRWNMRWRLQWGRLKELLVFSSGVIGASLINYFGGGLCGIVIAKGYSVIDLGYYDKGTQLPEQVSLNIFGAMTNVLLPTVASYQSEIGRVRSIIRRVVRTTSVFIMPIMVGLAVIAPEAIIVLFTDKWSFSTPIMQSFCLYYVATPFMLIDIQVFFALGHSGLRVVTESIRLLLIIAALASAGFLLKCSIVTLSVINALIAIMMAGVTALAVRNLIGYGIAQRFKDMCAPASISLVMGVLVVVLDRSVLAVSGLPVGVVLIIKVLSGVCFYTLGCVVTKNSVFLEIWDGIGRYVKEKVRGQ